MIINKYIKQIEKILNKEKIIKYKLLQTSFNIACVKIETSNDKTYISKFFIKNNKLFNAIESETKNILYLNKNYNYFPKIISNNNKFLIMEYIKNDNIKPKTTNLDLLKSIIELHSNTQSSYGFNFNTQIGGLEQVNDYENNWVNFYSNKRLNPIFELANEKGNMGEEINKKINFILTNMEKFIPKNPKPSLLHGDLWEGNILFNKKKFVGFIDPGSFFGHSEMEVAYLRWFNPSFIDKKFLDKYNDLKTLNKNYLDYEPVYQLYYALCNVVLWNRSYINETKKILVKLKV